MENSSTKTYLTKEFEEILHQYGFTLASMLDECVIIDKGITSSKEGKFKVVFFERKNSYHVYLLMWDGNRWTQARNPNHIPNPHLKGKAHTSYISDWNQIFPTREEAEQYYKRLLEEPIEFEITTSSEGTLYSIKGRVSNLL